MPSNEAIEAIWDSSMNDQIYDFGEAVRAVAKDHPQEAYWLVLPTSGVLAIDDSLGDSFLTLRLAHARLFGEPALYDAQLKPVRIEKTISAMPDVELPKNGTGVPPATVAGASVSQPPSTSTAAQPPSAAKDPLFKDAP
jgi:hypothetical protein